MQVYLIFSFFQIKDKKIALKISFRYDKKNSETSLTKNNDSESRSSSHEPIDNTAVFTTMFSSML